MHFPIATKVCTNPFDDSFLLKLGQMLFYCSISLAELST